MRTSRLPVVATAALYASLWAACAEIGGGTDTSVNAGNEPPRGGVFDLAGDGIDPHAGGAVPETDELAPPPGGRDHVSAPMVQPLEGNGAAITQRVMVIIYDNHDACTDCLYGNPPEELNGLLVAKLEEASIEKEYTGDFPHFEANLDVEITGVTTVIGPSPLLPGQTGSGAADYDAILDAHNVCNQVNAGLVDEVWLWGDHHAGYWEAIMAGPANQIFNTNGPPLVRPDCSRPVHVMGFNYERYYDYSDVNGYEVPSVAAPLHSLGHRFENTLALYLDGKTRSTVVAGDTYFAFDGQNGYTGHWEGDVWVYDPPLELGYVGNVHYPTNVSESYQYDWTVTRNADFIEWNPQHSGPMSPIGCTQWNCFESEYQTQWMQNFPGQCLSAGMTKANGAPMPNWWHLLLKGDVVYESEDCALVAPGAPQQFHVASTTSSATLSWAPVAGADEYRIERCVGVGCTNFAEVATTVQTSWTGSLSSGQVDRYRVRAFNGLFGPYTGVIDSSVHWVIRAEAVCPSGALAPGQYRAHYALWPPSPLVWDSTSPGAGTRTVDIVSRDSWNNLYVYLTDATGHVLLPVGTPPHPAIHYGQYFNPLTWMAKINRRIDNPPVLPSGTYTISYQASTEACAQTVFVTSTVHDGNFGGLAGADAYCQARADAAGVPGFYKAWLSTSTEDAVDRIANTPYQLTTGEVIALDKADLVDGAIAAAIDRDEFGASVSAAGSGSSAAKIGEMVFTGTRADGNLYIEGVLSKLGGTYQTCEDWTSNWEEQLGRHGIVPATGPYWTSAGNSLCSQQRHLYCFESPSIGIDPS